MQNQENSTGQGMEMEPPKKKCSNCGEDKPLKEFRQGVRNLKRVDGTPYKYNFIRPECKRCEYLIRRENEAYKKESGNK